MTTFSVFDDSGDFFDYSGYFNASSFFIDAFFDFFGDLAFEAQSANSTTITIFNPDTGITTTATGTGFAFLGPLGDETPIAGTISSLSMVDNNLQPIGEVTGLAWSLVEFSNVLGAVELGDLQPAADLLNAGGPITVDGSAALGGLIMFDLLTPELTALITQPITVIGSPDYDEVYGGAGDDTILFGFGDNSDFIGGFVGATFGNDTIDFSNATPFDFPWFSYSEFIDGAVTCLLYTSPSPRDRG